jgi:hypothetical protein
MTSKYDEETSPVPNLKLVTQTEADGECQSSTAFMVFDFSSDQSLRRFFVFVRIPRVIVAGGR